MGRLRLTFFDLALSLVREMKASRAILLMNSDVDFFGATFREKKRCIDVTPNDVLPHNVVEEDYHELIRRSA